MSKNIPLANDEECAARRQKLIEAGIITENNSNLVDRSGESYVSTKSYAADLRKSLEKQGLVSSDYFEIPPLSRRAGGAEEGEYKARPIRNDGQYARRRLLYFRMLQEILVSRRELNLSLRPKLESDPDWVF